MTRNYLFMSLPTGLKFPASASVITDRTAQILSIYDKWYNDLIGKKFLTKSEHFRHFDSTEAWDLELECFDFMQYVHPDHAVREASVESSKKVAEFGNKWSMDVDVYKTIQSFYDSFKDQLVGEESLCLTRTLNAYKHKGIHLDASTRKQLEAINQRLTELNITYGTNLNELDDHMFFSKEELHGVDDDFIESLDRSDDGKYKVTTKYDHINMIMPYCDVEETRKQLSKTFALRGKEPFKNHLLLQQALELRKEKALLLGYDSYSRYVLSNRRMATSPEQVNKFLDELANKMNTVAVSDASLISKHFNKDKMESWNLSYYTNIYKKDVLKYDQKLVQEYFPLETLLPKLLGTFEDIFHLSIVECDANADQKWHESAKCYAVRDATSDELIGHFFMDLYPRDGKYGHAAAFTLKRAYIPTSTCEHGEVETVETVFISPNEIAVDTLTTDVKPVRSTPVSAMVCNFTRPTKEKPSLLTFNEVETFFHELGHIFHQLLSKNRFSMFSGTAVEHDFVECPSQALENWCYEEGFLTRISSHYKTGATIPVEIMDNIKKNKHLFNGLHYVRQLVFAMYDMKLHSGSDNVDVETAFAEFQDKLSPLVHGESCMAANFGHLMGGYESGYYGYLWSEVYAAEVFQLFKQSGDIFNHEIGLHYRRCILEKGGTETGFNMMVNLLGREPNSDAFMRSFE